MKEFDVLDWMVAGATLLAGIGVVVALGGDKTEVGPNMMGALYVAGLIYLATRFSALKERKERSEYEKRIKRLLKRIADNTQS